MKKNIITLFLISKIFAVGGFGMYGGPNSSSILPTSSGGGVVLTPQASSLDLTVGFFVYVDALPWVDIDIAWETGFNTYPFSFTVDGVELGEKYDWWAVRESKYYTVRKTVIGGGIPFLAKAKVYGGLGFNQHTVSPNISVQFIEDAFPSFDTVQEAVNQDFSDGDITGAVTDYIDQFQKNVNGFHIQGGLQLKVTALSLFVNARYTFANEVIEGKSGFTNVWAGLAFGI